MAGAAGEAGAAAAAAADAAAAAPAHTVSASARAQSEWLKSQMRVVELSAKAGGAADAKAELAANAHREYMERVERMVTAARLKGDGLFLVDPDALGLTYDRKQQAAVISSKEPSNAPLVTEFLRLFEIVIGVVPCVTQKYTARRRVGSDDITVQLVETTVTSPPHLQHLTANQTSGCDLPDEFVDSDEFQNEKFVPDGEYEDYLCATISCVVTRNYFFVVPKLRALRP